MKLKSLSILTCILFVLSVIVYFNENKRGADLLYGSDYIKGLDINKIQKVSLKFRDDKSIVFTRDSNKFVLENYKSYPASTEKVNDLIFKIASIRVKEKVLSSADEKDLSKYELGKSKRKYFVEIFDSEGKRTVAFSVGKSNKGKGNYLYKEGQEDIYLSQDSLWLDSSYRDFINSVLLTTKKDDISKVALKTKNPITIAKGDKGFLVESPSTKKYKDEKVSEYLGNLSSISFEDFYSLTEPKVQSLDFSQSVEVELNNKLVYRMSFAKKSKEHFIKVSALLEEQPTQFVVKQSDSKEDLQKIEDVIQAQTTAQRFNLEKGAWVYKIKESTYKNLVKGTKFFL